MVFFHNQRIHSIRQSYTISTDYFGSIFMNSRFQYLLICISIPLLTGAFSALLSGGMSSFSSLEQPIFAPPKWLFPIVWTILYILMGFASCIVRAKKADRNALFLYALQLAFNFWWSIIFFRYEKYFAAFLWLLILWLLIYLTIKKFSSISKTAGYLLFPYLIWVTFAGYLNLGIALLN